MATHTSRKPIRKQIATLLGQITEFTAPNGAVYDHESKKLAGLLRTAMVYSDGTEDRYAGNLNEYHSFFIQIVIDRVDAATAEDELDDLEMAARQKMSDNVGVAGVWDDIEINDENSEVTYFEFRQDGRQYRSTRFRVTARRCQ